MDETVLNSHPVSLGDRIESDGHYATVKYVGSLPVPVSNKTAPSDAKPIMWIGIEWDDPKRGKHDGSYNGVRYFETSHPTSGSFLRFEKVNTGVSYMSALENRYGLQSSSTGSSDDQNMFVRGRNQQTAVEAVGLEKVAHQQSQFSELRAVSLRGMCISHASDAVEIAANSKNVTELDLSMNLLPSWKLVAHIALQMKKLKLLNVSENRLKLLSEDADTACSFKTVSVLLVNRMAYDWNELFQTLKMFPVVEEIHMCYNRVCKVTDILDLPCSVGLKLINLEGNPLCNWEGLTALGSLPLLTTLIVNDCGLSEISFSEGSQTQTSLFPALTSLSVSGNKLCNWSSVDELNKLCSLTHLRLGQNPLPVESTILSQRCGIIARIAKLQYCNGAKILRSERQDAELSYMHTYGSNWKATKLDKVLAAEFAKAHPRFQTIVQIYGVPDDAEIQPPATSALKNNLITVRIEVKLTDRPPEVKQLPKTMTIQRLRTIVQRAYKVCNASAIKLSYMLPREALANTRDNVTNDDTVDSSASNICSKNVSGKLRAVELDNDRRDLSFYSVEDGAVILAEW